MPQPPARPAGFDQLVEAADAAQDVADAYRRAPLTDRVVLARLDGYADGMKDAIRLLERADR